MRGSHSPAVGQFFAGDNNHDAETLADQLVWLRA
jgi:hypothetical protein